MIVEEVTHKTKCDFCGCKNLADMQIKSLTDNKKRMALCKECLQSIAQVYLKHTTPKSIDAPYKKQKKLR